MELAHADQAQIRQVRSAIRITLRQTLQREQVLRRAETELDQTIAKHVQDDCAVSEVKCRLRKDRLARQERFVHLLRD